MKEAIRYPQIIAVTRMNNFKMTGLYLSHGLPPIGTVNRIGDRGQRYALQWFNRAYFSLGRK